MRLLLVLDQWEELFTVKPIGEEGRNRLPESCGCTKDLDLKEVLKLAAEMCAEQRDEESANGEEQAQGT